MADVLHPDEALVAGERPFPVIASCDHYAGTEAFMKKALQLQVEYEGRFAPTLHDLANDPGETRSIASDHPDILAAHRKRIDELEDELGLAAPMPRSELTADEKARLHVLGYLDDESTDGKTND